ncbi:CPBP family glutamic-type intramembrane protease [Methanolobus profundi]|uniref:CAAX protease self-immunity n=1 Tax=Methanolobus profundi TaxID=487685 RepID=A0A1I4PP05_9EURY|nr:CPBP family glutamic-type intramembrane protease [Methanolobus profundi]SFM29562.1 CAAX protease self-immunity [Methanolobus profundi]
MRIRELVDWNIYWFLFMLAEFALLATIPYSITMSEDFLYDLGVSLPNLLATQFIRSTVILMISVFLGLYLGKKVGFGTPILNSLSEKRELPSETGSIVKLSIFIGLVLTVVIFVLDYFVFSMFAEPLIVTLTTPPLWERFLYSLYAGIVEEVVLRFMLVTLLVWISWKIKKTADGQPTRTGILISILIISLIYAIGYFLFNSSATIDQISALRFVVINGVAGIVFGCLYWKKGLEASLIANLTASFMLFVVLGSFF